MMVKGRQFFLNKPEVIAELPNNEVILRRYNCVGQTLYYIGKRFGTKICAKSRISRAQALNYTGVSSL